MLPVCTILDEIGDPSIAMLVCASKEHTLWECLTADSGTDALDQDAEVNESVQLAVDTAFLKVAAQYMLTLHMSIILHTADLERTGQVKFAAHRAFLEVAVQPIRLLHQADTSYGEPDGLRSRPQKCCVLCKFHPLDSNGLSACPQRSYKGMHACQSIRATSSYMSIVCLKPCRL